MNKNYNDLMETQKQERTDPTQLVRPRRPLLLTLLFWIFILLSLLGWLRFVRALVDRSLIQEMANPGAYWYLLITGLCNGLTTLPVIWGMVRRAAWTPTLIWVLSILFPVIYWIERLALWSDPTAADNWAFMLVLTFLWFGLVICALQSKRGKSFFTRDTDEV
jgi:hypothetical protein